MRLRLAMALLDPEIDVLGVTATAGCVSGAAATRNVQAIIEHLDPAKWPRIGASEGKVASRPAPRSGPSRLGSPI